MGAATSKKKPLEEQRANLVLTLAEDGLYGRIPKLVAPFLSYPHQPAVTTAEPGYVTRYWSLNEAGRASFVHPHEILREEIWSPEPARLPRWEVECDKNNHLAYVDTQSKKKHKKMPNDFIDPMIEMSSVNSSCQAFAVACNRMFDAVYYEPLLREAFDAITGRQKERLVGQLGEEEAMRQLIANRKLFRRRYANLSVIYVDQRTSEGKLIRNVRKQAGIKLIQWPHPVDEDYKGRPFFQEVDGRVVMKIQREGHQRDVSR